MKKVLGVGLGLVALVVVGAIGIFAFTGSSASTNPLGAVAQDAKAAATNAAIDASGVKSKVQDTIDTYRDDIAAATGLTGEQVDAAVNGLDIENWQATSLPSDASATSTVDGSSLGIDGSVTTYDDPSYVTITAYGQTITMSVPESAQTYLPLLSTVQ